jgi:hypothetical protein
MSHWQLAIGHGRFSTMESRKHCPSGLYKKKERTHGSWLLNVYQHRKASHSSSKPKPQQQLLAAGSWIAWIQTSGLHLLAV